MKKILTVLLALSVVFTYTVGTAFAASTDSVTQSDATKAILDKQAELQEQVEAAATIWTGKQTYTTSITPIDVELSAKHVKLDNREYFTPNGVDNLANEVIQEANVSLEAKVADLMKQVDSYTESSLEIALKDLAGVVQTYIDNFEAQVFELNLTDLSIEYAKADYTAYFESIDLKNYSNEPNEPVLGNTDGLSNRALVEGYIEKAIEGMNAETINSAYNGNNSVRSVANKYYTMIDKIKTIEEQEEEFANLSEAIEYYQVKIESNLLEKKAEIKRKLNTALKDENKKGETTNARNIQKALNRIDSDFAAVIECAKAEIGYQKTPTAVANKYNAWTKVLNENLGYDSTNNYEPIDVVGDGDIELYVERAKKAAELRAKAEEMKAETGFNGTPMYNAEDVDEALAKDLEVVYTVYTGGTFDDELGTLIPVEDQVKAEMNRVINGTTVTIDKIKYDVVSVWANETKYDDEKLAEVESIQADALAAIRAAETVEAVDAAFLEAYAKYDAVPTIADQKAYQGKNATKEQLKAYEAKLEAALKTKMADYGQAKFNEDYDVTEQDIVSFTDGLSENYLQKAYDAADLEAKYQEALDFINDLRNKDQMKAEADAINAAIRDLAGKTLTAEDEDAVLAVAEREANFTEYKAILNVPTKYTTYGAGSYMRTMANLITSELKDAYNSIGTVTVEDEVAINTLVKMAETYTENYSKYTGYDSDLVNDIYALYDKLMDEKVKAVNNAIGVIDASADPLDVKAIQAAREAYDALGEDAIKVSSTRYHKLMSLENLADEYIISSVESLKVVKNHSTAGKTNGKSWIRIEWSTQGDDSYVQGYEVYKSTKKNSGYKYSFTTKNPDNKWYKNTSGLKKNTRYYYKVRAFVEIDGQKYYSDWSNKAYRYAK